MIIILENISDSILTIGDMGLELEPEDSVDIIQTFPRDAILNSNDLESEFNLGNIQFTIDSSVSTYGQVIRAITGITEYEHENLDTLTHALYEQSYFQVERDADDEVEKIVYYKDGSLLIKIREEEIIRDNEGEVSSIIKRQFDESGNTIKQETQIINRTPEGDVDSITSGVI